MIRYPMILAASLAASLSLSAIGAPAASVPANIKAAVADSNRSDADKQRDANRKPAETLAFIGVKSGQSVAELLPGGGYFTRIFSKIAGPKGHVTALWPAGTPDKYVDKTKPIAADAAYTNVTVVAENAQVAVWKRGGAKVRGFIIGQQIQADQLIAIFARAVAVLDFERGIAALE